MPTPVIDPQPVEAQQAQTTAAPDSPAFRGPALAEAPAEKMPSALDELRAEFAKEAEEPRLFKQLPARGERLVAQYKPLPLETAKKAIEQESDPTMLIESLIGIFIRDKNHVSANERCLVPLGLWSGQPQLDPLRLDKRLTDLIGIPFGSATQILMALFENNDLALSAQAAELGEWSVKTKSERLQDFAIGS